VACIGIDVGKYEHVAVAYDGLGQLLARPLRFGIRAADYQALFAWVALVAPDPPRRCCLVWNRPPLLRAVGV